MIANLRVPQKNRLPSQNNTVDDDKLRVITESGWGKMRNESRKRAREDERWGALTWWGSRSGRIKDGGWESGIYWVGGMDGGKRRGGERPLGRIVLIEVSFPTRWDSTLITLCRSHHHGGAGLIRERGETVLGERETYRREREKLHIQTHAKCGWDVLNKRVGEADLRCKNGERRTKCQTAREKKYIRCTQWWTKTEKGSGAQIMKQSERERGGRKMFLNNWQSRIQHYK